MPWEKTRADRQRDARVYGAKWRRARDACLRAARWRCQIQMEGCQGAASQVDHIDGVENDPDHQRLRAACTECHKRITAQQGGGYRAAGRAAPDPAPRPGTAW